jgi:hypothetical protein
MKKFKKMTLVELNDFKGENKISVGPEHEINVKAKPLYFIENEIDTILSTNENVNEKLRKYFYALNRFLFFKNNSEQHPNVTMEGIKNSLEDKSKEHEDLAPVLDSKRDSEQSELINNEEITELPSAQKPKDENIYTNQIIHKQFEETTPKENRRSKKTPKSVRSKKKKNELENDQFRTTPFTITKQLFRTPIKTRSQIGKGIVRKADTVWLKF